MRSANKIRQCEIQYYILVTKTIYSILYEKYINDISMS